jgi:hypothetical protein
MNAGLAGWTSLAGAGDRCDHDNIYNEHRECSYQRRIAGVYESHEAAHEANNESSRKYQNSGPCVPQELAPRAPYPEGRSDCWSHKDQQYLRDREHVAVTQPLEVPIDTSSIPEFPDKTQGDRTRIRFVNNNVFLEHTG